MLIANSSFRFGIVLSPQHRLVAWTCRKVDFRSPKPRSRSIFRRFYYAGNPRNWVSGSFCWRTIYSAARSKLFSPEHRIGNLQRSVQASGRPARGGGGGPHRFLLPRAVRSGLVQVRSGNDDRDDRHAIASLHQSREVPSAQDAIHLCTDFDRRCPGSSGWIDTSHHGTFADLVSEVKDRLD